MHGAGAGAGAGQRFCQIPYVKRVGAALHHHLLVRKGRKFQSVTEKKSETDTQQ